MSLTVRMKCVSAHKVADNKGNLFFDARLLAAAASEQADGVFSAAGKPAGKLDLQQLAAQPFQTDTEYTITIEAVASSSGADPAAGAQESTSASTSSGSQPQQAPPVEKPAEKPADKPADQAATKPADPSPAPQKAASDPKAADSKATAQPATK